MRMSTVFRKHLQHSSARLSAAATINLQQSQHRTSWPRPDDYIEGLMSQVKRVMPVCTEQQVAEALSIWQDPGVLQQVVHALNQQTAPCFRLVRLQRLGSLHKYALTPALFSSLLVTIWPFCCSLVGDEA